MFTPEYRYSPVKLKNKPKNEKLQSSNSLEALVDLLDKNVQPKILEKRPVEMLEEIFEFSSDGSLSLRENSTIDTRPESISNTVEEHISDISLEHKSAPAGKQLDQISILEGVNTPNKTLVVPSDSQNSSVSFPWLETNFVDKTLSFPKGKGKVSTVKEGQELNFRAGALFKNKEPWQNLIKQMASVGAGVPDILIKTVDRGAVDMLDPIFFDKKRTDLKFCGRSFTNFDAMAGVKFNNYSGVREFKPRLRKDLDYYCEVGVLKEVSAAEAAAMNLTCSPINYLWNEDKQKSRLIYHWCYNAFYTRPKIYLETPLNYLFELRKAKKLLTNDLTKCFYQFKTVEENRRYLGFVFEGRYFTWSVVPMGCSQSVYIVQTINKTACRYYSLTTGLFANVFVDDFASVPGNEVFLDEILGRLGYQFKNSKRELGEIVEFCGFEIDVR